MSDVIRLEEQLKAENSASGSGFNRLDKVTSHPNAICYEHRHDSFPSIAVNNMNIKMADISKKKAPITKHSSYNQNRVSRNSPKLIEAHNHRLNNSARPDCNNDLNLKELDKKKQMAIERQNRDTLPSFNTSSRLMNLNCPLVSNTSTMNTKTAPNVTIYRCSYVSQNQMAAPKKPSTHQQKKISESAGKTLKKLEIRTYNKFCLDETEKKLHPAMALDFRSFNNSKTNIKKIESVKEEEFASLGKRKEINLCSQKGIFRAQSFESKEMTSRVSSLKRRKLSETSKQKDLVHQSELDSMNPLNQQPSIYSNFKSFQANNSMSDFVLEQSLPKKKKMRHSTGVPQPKTNSQLVHSKNNNFSTNLQHLRIVPNKIYSDQKGNSSQNISSLNDISGSIKYRVNSNTVSSQSNHISSLNEIEKMKQGQIEPSKEERLQGNGRPVLHKIIESENAVNDQKKKKGRS